MVTKLTKYSNLQCVPKSYHIADLVSVVTF